MRITKKLRTEAIELAGIRAAFWADGSHEAGPGDDEYPRAIALVDAAEVWAIINDGPFDGLDRHVQRAAEAQAMFIEGWRP